MPDDQNNAQPLDDSLEIESSELEESLESPQPMQQMQGGPAGAEQQPTLEKQKSVDSQTNKELPPFIQKTLASAKDGQKLAQQKASQSLVDEAVAIEEGILGELATLASFGVVEQPVPAEPQPVEEPAQQQESPPVEANPLAIHGQATMAEETPEPVAPRTTPQESAAPQSAESPQNIIRMADNLRSEVREAVQTPVPRTNQAESQRYLDIESDVGRDATVSLLKAVIEKLEEGSGGIDKLAMENSEEALFRMIQKDALKLILERVRDGEWDPGKSMESLAMKMGIFSIIGLFRELKSKTSNETMRQRIQQAIDYMLNENDRLDLEEAQAHKASDAVQDDNYADPTATTTTDDTAGATIATDDTSVGTVSVAGAAATGSIFTQPAQGASIPAVAQPVAAANPPSTPQTATPPQEQASPVAPLPPGIG